MSVQRITFNTGDPQLIAAVRALLGAYGITPQVERVDMSVIADQWASLDWLAEQVAAKGFVSPTTKDMLVQCGFSSLNAVSALTLQDCLEKPIYLVFKLKLITAIFAVMVEAGLTFADGADPATFTADPITREDWEEQVVIVNVLLREGIVSWAMFPYLSEAFVGDIWNIGYAKRMGMIRAQLAARGLHFKNP